LTLNEIFQHIIEYSRQKNYNKEKIVKAYEIAKKYHKGQLRKSGEEYIIHPLKVAYYLTEYKGDEESLIAAILHDTVEDTDYKLIDVENDFGSEIAKLIDGLTKFGQNRFRDAATMDRKIESMRKWFLVMQQDIRVAIIKLIDRLHNMETLEGHNDIVKQKKIAKETLDVYVKIANKLGIDKLQNELETLCLKHLDFKNYKILLQIQKKEKYICEQNLINIQNRLKKLDKNNSISGIKCEIPFIFEMYEQDIHLKEEIRGALPLIYTINSKTKEDCYKILYIIHSIWKTERLGIKDYINHPNQNGYQGLHTTIIFEEGKHILFKIKTDSMEKYNNYGITEECFSNSLNRQQLLSWIKNLPSITEGAKNNSKIFWNQLKNEILGKSIIVHTTKDETLVLPSMSTVLDAAVYSYKTKVWKLKKVFINGVKVSFFKKLKHNDTIHFNFSDTIEVSHEWLAYCKTAFALKVIKQGLQAENNNKKILIGKDLLMKKLSIENKGFIEEININSLLILFEKCKVTTLDELYMKIAEGKISIVEVFESLNKYNKKFFFASKKTIILKGNNHQIIELLQEIPDNIISDLTWVFTNKKEIGELEIKADKINYNNNWDELINIINEKKEIKYIFKNNYWNYKRNILALIVINILWGLDPVIASSLLKTNITPLVLTTLRFLSVTIFLLLIILIQNIFDKEYSQKNIPMFNFQILFISIFLFCVAIFTYQGLLGTLPSNYLLLLRSYAVIFLGIILLKNKNISKLKSLSFLILTFIGFISLIFVSNEEWQLKYKIAILISIISFGLYSYLSNNYKQKFKIFIRYYRLQFLISLYCSIICLITLFFIPFPHLTQKEYILGILFSIIFTGIPHIIYFSLIKSIKETTTFSYLLSAAFFVGLITEMIFFNIYPGWQKSLTIFLIFGGFSSLMFLYKRKPLN